MLPAGPHAATHPGAVRPVRAAVLALVLPFAQYLGGCGDDASTRADAEPDGPSDAASSDSGGGDTALPDAAREAGIATPDASSDAAADAAVQADSAAADAGSDVADAADAAPVDSVDPARFVQPESLAATGLFRPGSVTELADGVHEVEPRYPLWSDGATKRRYLWLPPGETVDTSDMDHWVFPLGTKAWKDFTRDGKKLETRLLWKTSSGWFTMAFAWNEAETEALPVPDGVPDARGTEHDIPDADACSSCHDGQPDKLLGISAIQLSHDGVGSTFGALAAAGLLSEAPADADFRLPEGADWDALGYLHANCGNCHNPMGPAADRVDMVLWLPTAERSDISQTPSYLTTVGIALDKQDQALSLRVAPGAPEQSGLLERMSIRGEEIAMPPLASERVDDDGIARVRAFIMGLPP